MQRKVRTYVDVDPLPSCRAPCSTRLSLVKKGEEEKAFRERLLAERMVSVSLNQTELRRRRVLTCLTLLTQTHFFLSMELDQNEIEDDFTFECPFTLTLTGPTGCGKSSFIYNMIATAEDRFTEPIGKIYYFFNIQQPLFSEIQKLGLDVTFIRGLPDANWVEENVESGTNSMIVLDDVATHLNRSTKTLFTVLSHHLQTNVVLTVHNVFDKNPVFRDISLNSKYLVLFKNPRDPSSIHKFARQLSPYNAGEVIRAYEHATKKACSYLLVDLAQTTSDDDRLVGNIFYENDDEYIIY